MNYKLIILPQPILVSDEEIKEGDWYLCWETIDSKPTNYITLKATNKESVDLYSLASNYLKIIAGLPELPKLDLSLIAEEIEWVDVEKLDMRFVLDGQDIYTAFLTDSASSAALGGFLRGCRFGFKAAQSLNEKKYSEEDLKYAMFQVFKNGSRSPKEGREGFGEIHNRVIQQISKHKEYLVEVEMEYWKTSGVYDQPDTLLEIPYPKITNNTIKVTKLL